MLETLGSRKLRNATTTAKQDNWSQIVARRTAKRREHARRRLWRNPTRASHAVAQHTANAPTPLAMTDLHHGRVACSASTATADVLENPVDHIDRVNSSNSSLFPDSLSQPATHKHLTRCGWLKCLIMKNDHFTAVHVNEIEQTHWVLLVWVSLVEGKPLAMFQKFHWHGFAARQACFLPCRQKSNAQRSSTASQVLC